MKSKFILNGNNFDDLEGFYREIYNLMNLYEDWIPAHNLDALNDMLYNGLGKDAELFWLNSQKSKSDLGMDASIEFYQNKLNQGYPYNLDWVREKLEELKLGKGKTLFEILVEMINEHPQINLILN